MPMTHRTLFPPPDENRALEQLERFHREILRARRDRERASTEFDGFVRNLQGQGQENTATSPAGRRATRPIVQPAERPTAPAETTPALQARPLASAHDATAGTPVHTDPPAVPRSAAAAEDEVPTAMAASPRGRSRGLLVAAAILLVGAVVALVLWQRSQRETGQEQAPIVNTTPAPSSPAPGASSPAASGATRPAPRAANPQPPPAPAVSPSTIELTTVRPVWMRVIVDGERVLEREVPAGQHLTYTPSSGLVVRAGDAGGVRVKIGNGPEEVLGRDAFPVTRRFSVPKP